ncbi:MAG: translesion error-prone DNA polymerase V autoproteolytic subunit [Propionibacteriaceae bacterium]|jgi:DNA polymerase V|nr:translesion error-prone DNA polymerase V autoproteolytic subunit [Propionibacteriaceae bacterium]
MTDMRRVRAAATPVSWSPAALATGFPSPAQDYWAPPVDLTEVLVRDGPATFLARVAGDSMIEAGIFDGDVVVVDRSLEAGVGDVVVAVVDGEFTLKRLASSGGRVVLRAENRRYPDLAIAEGSEVRVWGVVTWNLHQLR